MSNLENTGMWENISLEHQQCLYGWGREYRNVREHISGTPPMSYWLIYRIPEYGKTSLWNTNNVFMADLQNTGMWVTISLKLQQYLMADLQNTGMCGEHLSGTPTMSLWLIYRTPECAKTSLWNFNNVFMADLENIWMGDNISLELNQCLSCSFFAKWGHFCITKNNFFNLHFFQLSYFQIYSHCII